MSKNTNIADLINYISVDGSGNVVLTTGGQVATQSYVTTAVSNLVNSAPSTLDTLNELAAALGNDANFATTVTNSIATKLPLSGGTLTGALSGTSATFSTSNGVIGNFVGTGGKYGQIYSDANAAAFGASTTTSLGSNYMYINPTSNFISFITNSNEQLKIASSGAATFSSSVTATQLTINGTSASAKLNVLGDASAYYNTAWFNNSTGASVIRFGHISPTGNATGFIESLVNSGSTVGNLALQPFGGNVGIGTTAPTSLLTTTNGNVEIQSDGSSSMINYLKIGTHTNGNWGSYIGASSNYGSTLNTDLRFGVSNGGTSLEAMRITSGGYLLLGTTTANYGQAGRGTFEMNGSTDNIIAYKVGGSLAGYIYSTASNVELYSTTRLDFATNGAERMRITSGGSLIVGATSIFASGLVCSDGGTTYTPFAARVGSTSNSGQMYFLNPNGIVGSITSSGSATAFNTSSDYRLKQDLKDYNGLDLVSAIKTYDYEWKIDQTRAYGVMAHELAEVIPYAVNGEKDGEQMQGVDYSKIVPLLVKAIQELKAENDELCAILNRNNII